MNTNVINLEEKRRVRERERIIAKINDYYRQLLERGWIVCVPEKKK